MRLLKVVGRVAGVTHSELGESGHVGCWKKRLG